MNRMTKCDYESNDGGIFYCDVHGSRFALDGAPLNQVDSKTAKPLKIYNTELNGNICGFSNNIN